MRCKGIKLLCFLSIAMLLFTVSEPIEASAGRLRNASITTCNGVTYGQHSSDNHWHVASLNSNGTYNATGSPIYGNPCLQQETPQIQQQQPSIPVEPPKSSENTISAIKIDGNIIDVAETMVYTTTNETITFDFIPVDEKSTIEYNATQALELGENNIEVVVSAEDGTTRSYNIQVIREKKLSSNVGVYVYMGEKRILDFDENIEVDYDVEYIELTYELEDDTSKIDMPSKKKLNVGDNKVAFTVTAEDGTSKKYIIHINRAEEKEATIMGTVLTLAVLGGAGYFGYEYYKKKRNIKNKKIFSK